MDLTRRSLSILLFALLAILLFFLNPKAQAADHQAHFRYGLLYGSYSGPVSGSFTVPSSFDFEYEWFSTNKRSFFLRMILAIDIPNSRPYYTYAGFGMHYYFNSKGMSFEETERGISISSVPAWRYYWGIDGGISQVLVESFGKVLSVVSTLFDVGVHVGTIYQVDRRLGVEAQLGVTTGYGFSSVAVQGFSARGLLGVTYFF